MKTNSNYEINYLVYLSNHVDWIHKTIELAVGYEIKNERGKEETYENFNEIVEANKFYANFKKFNTFSDNFKKYLLENILEKHIDCGYDIIFISNNGITKLKNPNVIREKGNFTCYSFEANRDERLIEWLSILNQEYYASQITNIVISRDVVGIISKDDIGNMFSLEIL